MKKLSLVLAAALWTPPLSATSSDAEAEWSYVTGGRDTMVFVRKNDTKPWGENYESANFLVIMRAMDPSTRNTDNFEKFIYINCGSGEYRLRSTTFYSAYKQVHWIGSQYGMYTMPTPGSVEEQVVKKVCKNDTRQLISDPYRRAKEWFSKN